MRPRTNKSDAPTRAIALPFNIRRHCRRLLPTRLSAVIGVKSPNPYEGCQR
jgi:hypothetical protein